MRLGIFGGSFNPIHNGHVHLANELMKAARLDRLLVIPSNISPQKSSNGSIDPVHRLNMCALAFDDERIGVSDCEIRRGGKSYTFDTLTQIKREYGDSELFLFVGSDMLLSFHTWFKYERILSLCTVCAVSRGADDSYEELCAYNDKTLSGRARIFAVSPVEISSTEIRAMLSAGGDASSFVPPKVLQYIKEHSLYE